MRFLTNEGIYVVKFERDTVINVGTNANDKSDVHLMMRHMPNKKLGDKVTSKEFAEVEPHTALIFNDEKSIDSMIELLIKCRKKLTGYSE